MAKSFESSSTIHNGLNSRTSTTITTKDDNSSKSETFVGRSVSSKFAVGGGVLGFFFLFMLCVSLYTKSVTGHSVTFRGLLETLSSVPQLSIARSLPDFSINLFGYHLELPFLNGLLKICYFAFDSVVYLFNFIWHFLAYFF